MLSTLLPGSFILIMEQRTFNYSLKNIPIPHDKQYKKNLLEKSEEVIKRMRWKAVFLDKEETESRTKEHYGFKSRNCPPQIIEMEAFENELLDTIRNITFRRNYNQFQKVVKNDIKSVKTSNKAFIAADKTRNMYEMNKSDYDKLLLENITKTYKKSSTNKYNEINTEAKTIATKLKIQDRATQLARKQAFITLKDHKENFENIPKCRLINPAKSDLGRVSKQILENINAEIKTTQTAQQWRNSNNVIEWFNQLENKELCTFTQFDIVDFYPSITEVLLTKSLDYAKQFVQISREDTEIIMHARKSLLFNNESPWSKKDSTDLFDVTMGSFDGAEICELVGLYILSILGNKYNKNQLGLYRDDGLAAFYNTNSQESDRIRKEIIQEFGLLGLKITISTNMKIVNFLDITFNLSDATYKPYKKPNDELVYINASSNHPPNIIKQLPHNISKRISDVSSNREIFEKAAPTYNKALKDAGYTEEIQYIPPTNITQNKENKRRKRKIIWFNPPYSKSVQTNVAKKFLLLIDKHFPKNHKLHKIFNRNTIKVSYSTMQNFENIIRTHNNQILNPREVIHDDKKCNCRKKELCPLQGNCLIHELVYRGEVTNCSTEPTNNYIGLTEHSFKDRFYKHKNSFKYRNKINSTELSKHIWNLKDRKIENVDIKWTILDRAPAFKNGSKRCDLCLTEKYHIIYEDFETLNKRNELLSNCRHKCKFLLCNFKEIPPDKQHN